MVETSGTEYTKSLSLAHGSHTCGACPNGDTGDGHTSADIDDCAKAFSGDGYAGCVDVDESAGGGLP